ncbi:40S small subunit processome assembly factor 1-like [Mytilus edulis]|uniref:40S small subunit processome assembly factor 1-like n=1 Tax=Mytilus edulis TaxID=6550 RepID=UPI0039EF48C9
MADENITNSLLKRLHDYNESFLDESFNKKQKRKKKQRTDEDDLNKDSSNSKGNRRQKKKERKKQKKELLLNPRVNENIKNEDICKLTGQKRTLFEMKNELGLNELEEKLESEKQSISQKNKNGKPTSGPEVVVYENPSKRKRKNKGLGKHTGMKDGNSDEEFDMKRARFEVRKFGIKGFEGNKKDEAMVALLVQLGAKPPKNKFYNYKEFITMKKTEKANEKIQREIDRSLGYKVAPNRGKRRQKDRNDVGGYVDGQVGKFKDGVQFVKKADLKGFASKRKK